MSTAHNGYGDFSELPRDGWNDDATGDASCPFCHGTGSYTQYLASAATGEVVPCDCQTEENGQRAEMECWDGYTEDMG